MSIRKWHSDYKGRELHFIRDVLGRTHPRRPDKIALWKFQRAAIRALFKHRKLAISSSRSSGKTHFLGLLIDAFMFCEPSRVIVIGPSMRQIEKGAMSEARDGLANAKRELHVESSNAHEIKIDERHWALALPARDPDAMRGFHASPTVPSDPDADKLSEEDVAWLADQVSDESTRILLIFDEAPGIIAEAYRVMRGVMTKPNVFVVYSGNPTRGADEDHPYVKAFREGSSFHRIRVSALPAADFPPPSGIVYDEVFDHIPEYLVAKDEIDSALAEYDHADPILISDWAGTFPAGSTDFCVVPRTALEAAVGTRNGNLRPLGPRIGIDIGTGNPDMCVASLFVDGVKRVDHSWAPASDDREGQVSIASTIQALAVQWGEEVEGAHVGGSEWDGSPIPGGRISIDDSGLVGVCDILASRGVYVDRVNFAKRAAGQWRDIVGTQRFLNQRTEMHWVARRGLQEGVFVIPTKFRRSWDEATWTRFERTFDSKGALIKLEPKEKVQARHGRSPDTFDADILAMRAPDQGTMFGQTGGRVLGRGRNGDGQPIRNGNLRPTRLNGGRRIS